MKAARGTARQGELEEFKKKSERTTGEREMLLQEFEQDRAEIKEEILRDISKHEEERHRARGGSKEVESDPSAVLSRSCRLVRRRTVEALLFK